MRILIVEILGDIVDDIVESMGGKPVVCRSGHSYIKDKMRQENAVYGGEMSAHHYFREFSYCDSGMIPWLLVLELMSEEGKTLSALMQERIDRYPVSGEINSKVKDAAEVLARIEAEYGKTGKISKVDGLSVEYDNWRFNLRKSNTEPVIRLNVETRHDKALLEEKTAELLEKIMPYLTEKERDLARRARNIPTSSARRIDRALHSSATSLEVTVGYNYMHDKSRYKDICSLMEKIIDFNSFCV